MKPTIANLILRNARTFGHILVARANDDNSLAARCERCLEAVEFPQLAPLDVKDRELRLFRKAHANCVDTEDEPIVKPAIA